MCGLHTHIGRYVYLAILVDPAIPLLGICARKKNLSFAHYKTSITTCIAVFYRRYEKKKPAEISTKWRVDK